MSLVNDALKRATEVHKRNSPPPLGEAALKLRAIEPTVPAKKGIGLLLSATLIVLLAIGVVILVITTRKPPTVAARSVVAASAAVAPQVEVLVEPAAVIDPAPAVVEAAPPVLAPLKLQAVFYTPSKPSAIISGETVHVGDSVREMKVVAIGSASAILIGRAQTNFLTLK